MTSIEPVAYEDVDVARRMVIDLRVRAEIMAQPHAIRSLLRIAEQALESAMTACRIREEP